MNGKNNSQSQITGEINERFIHDGSQMSVPVLLSLMDGPGGR